MSHRQTTAVGAAPAPPPAWYPDPSGVGELRYWDGSRWTPGVVIGGQVTEREMPWPPVPGARVETAAPPHDDRVDLPARAGLYGLAGFLAGGAAGLGLALAGRALGLPDIAVLLLNLAGLWAGLLGACWRASRRYGTGNLARDFGLRIRGADVGWGVVMSIVARIAGAMVAIPFLFASKRLVGSNQGVYGKVTGDTLSFVVFGAIAVLGAPVVEELFFRGLLLRSLSSSRLGVGGAIAVQSVLFGLAHFSPLLGLANFSVMAIIAAAGVVFGIAAWWRRVGTSVIGHATFNLVAVVAAAFLLSR
jgi:membrane protease YdiL (CAAX protease family)